MIKVSIWISVVWMGSFLSCKAVALDGKWVGPWIDNGPGYFYQFSHNFDASRYAIVSSTIMNAPSRGFYVFDSTSVLQYKLGPMIRQEGPYKIYELDTVASQLFKTPRSHSTAGLFWQNRECGISSWQVNVPVEVSGKTCGNLRSIETSPWKKGAATYQILGESATEILMGDIWDDPQKDGTSPSRRPTKLYQGRSYKKAQ